MYPFWGETWKLQNNRRDIGGQIRQKDTSSVGVGKKLKTIYLVGSARDQPRIGPHNARLTARVSSSVRCIALHCRCHFPKRAKDIPHTPPILLRHPANPPIRVTGCVVFNGKLFCTTRETHSQKEERQLFPRSTRRRKSCMVRREKEKPIGKNMTSM